MSSASFGILKRTQLQRAVKTMKKIQVAALDANRAELVK